MPIYSHSRLSSYRQCPLKYRFTYVDGIKRRRTTIEAFTGTVFHKVMERLYEKAPQNTPSIEELKAIFHALWGKGFNDDIVCVRKEKGPDDYRALGLRAVEDYWKRYAPFDQGRVIGLERDIRTDLDGTGRYMVRCIIDRLMVREDGAMEIHDYKTSAFLPEQARADEDEQLALYEIAVRSTWPSVKQVELIWHYVVSDAELRSRRSEEQLSELAGRVCRTIDEIESAAEFPPNESELCSWCDHQEICPLFSHKFARAALPLEEYATESATGIVNAYANLEAKRRELSDAIKGIESKQERLKKLAVDEAIEKGVSRIFGDTHALTIRDDIKINYPKKDQIERAAFEEAMKGLGLWNEVLDVSWSALKSLAGARGWTKKDSIPNGLAKYLEVISSKQVRLSRRKDLGDGDENDD